MLLLVGEGETYGWALIGALKDLGVVPSGVDVGMAYRTLRELEEKGLVVSRWDADRGAPKRAYHLTDEGHRALGEWMTVMTERRRLIDEFLSRFDRRAQAEGG